tara:strand:+ start:13069 stop:13917 length:849 start_codon:yes stop_codon:yes gene_type:complete
MGIKSKVKSLLQKIKTVSIPSTPPLQPTFSSYKEAEKAAGNYEENELIKVIVAKSVKYKNSLDDIETINLDNLSNARTVRTLIAIAGGVNNNSLSVLDFGGSAGVHYFTAKKILNNSIKLKWTIVETESMVSEARLNNLENEELKFFSSLEEASRNNPKYDIVYANYSLCYTPEPLEYLKQLLELKYTTLFITNTALNPQNIEIVGLQTSSLATNGVGREIPKHLNISDKNIKYPFTVPSKEDVEEVILKHGNIISSFKEVKDSYKTEDGSFDNFGYIVTKK